MPVALPVLVFENELAVLVECPYVPVIRGEKEDAYSCEEIAEKVCRPYCGYMRDAMVKSQEVQLKFKGEEKFSIQCFNPANRDMLEKLKAILEAAGPVPVRKG